MLCRTCTMPAYAHYAQTIRQPHHRGGHMRCEPKTMHSCAQPKLANRRRQRCRQSIELPAIDAADRKSQVRMSTYAGRQMLLDNTCKLEVLSKPRGSLTWSLVLDSVGATITTFVDGRAMREQLTAGCVGQLE